LVATITDFTGKHNRSLNFYRGVGQDAVIDSHCRQAEFMHFDVLFRPQFWLRSGHVQLYNLIFVLIYLIDSYCYSGPLDPKSIEMLSALWRNVFVLISTIIADSGQNFEDLDRLIWNHRDIIFPKLIEWLDVRTPLGRRKPAIDFVSTLLRVTYRRRAEGTAATGFLCHIWHEPDETYGIAVCKKLLGFVDHTLESEERSSILHCLNHLCLLSTTAKTHAIQQRIVKKLVRGLRELGIKTVDMQCNNRKVSQALKDLTHDSLR